MRPKIKRKILVKKPKIIKRKHLAIPLPLMQYGDFDCTTAGLIPKYFCV